MTRRSTNRPLGRVVFVGAGPGDPGLLAVHAVEALHAAEVVVADADVPTAILAIADVAPRAAEPVPAETAKLMLADARAGSTVVRLVAGDVFADDAAGEEKPGVAGGRGAAR